MCNNVGCKACRNILLERFVKWQDLKNGSGKMKLLPRNVIFYFFFFFFLVGQSAISKRKCWQLCVITICRCHKAINISYLRKKKEKNVYRFMLLKYSLLESKALHLPGTIYSLNLFRPSFTATLKKRRSSTFYTCSGIFLLRIVL